MRFLPILILTAGLALAQQKQEEFYHRQEIPMPTGEIIEIGSIALMPKQQIAVTTRRGEVWICSGAYGDDLSKVSWKKFAHGLHEPFGMYYKDGSLFVTQRSEFTRLQDTDGDGSADVFEAINSDWEVSGDYHEYAFGSTPDKNGDVWIALCLTGAISAECDSRGWAVRITPEGKMIPTVSGIRSPGGIGFNSAGDAFYTDNQGNWNGSSSLKWLKPGSFQGNPSGNEYHKLVGLPAPPVPNDKSRVEIERQKHPTFIPPAVVFPHGKVGTSPSGITADTAGGKFGPWKDQLYVGENSQSEVQRVFLEKVNGIYQGAVFKFLEGFETGVVPVTMSQEAGVLFIGGTARGWGSRGTKPFTFERVKWTGKVPFEIQTMTANSDGFTLTFTDKVDPLIAADPATYSMNAWTYILQSDYGSPQVDQVSPTITGAKVSEDHKSVRLTIKGLVKGHVHHLNADGVKSAAGLSLWRPDAYYTLNEIP